MYANCASITQQKNGIRDAPPPFFQPMLVNDSGQLSEVCAQWFSSLGGDSLYSTYLRVEDMTRLSSGYLKALFQHRRAWYRPMRIELASTDIAIQPHSTQIPTTSFSARHPLYFRQTHRNRTPETRKTRSGRLRTRRFALLRALRIIPNGYRRLCSV